MENWFWILGWSLSILTMAGNGFIIFLACSKRQLRTKTNAFVVSLAVADFFVGMTVVPPWFFCEMITGCDIHLHWISSLRLLFSYASVMNLCSLVVDRYIAVVKPLKYLTFMTRRHVIQMVSVSWGIPIAFRICISLNSRIFKSLYFWDFLLWATVIFFELLPCFILIINFVSMLQVVCKHERAARTREKQLRYNHNRVSFKAQEQSAVKIIAVVIGLFLLCYGIYIRCSFLHAFKKVALCNDKEYKIPILILNSAINPIAYAFFKRDIRKEIKRRLCGTIVKERNKIEPVDNGNCHPIYIA